MHRRCLRYYYSFVFNNPPFSPFLRVTLLQTLNTSGKPYHSKILKTLLFLIFKCPYGLFKDLVLFSFPFPTPSKNVVLDLLSLLS